MFIANDENGNRISITDARYKKDEVYFCPICKGKLQIKDGSVNASHFAHVSLEICDDFSNDMSEWHLEWQKQFPMENREVIFDCEGEVHRADVFVNDYIVEFQHSKISREEFNARNKFYRALGYKVIWIIDVINEYENGYLKCYEETYRYGNGGKYAWKYAWKFMQDWNPKIDKGIFVFVQIEDSDFQEQDASYIERITWVPMNYEHSDFKRFCTSYSITNLQELRVAMYNKKL